MAARRYRLEGNSHLPVLSQPLEAAGWTRTTGDDWDLWWSWGAPVPPEVYAGLSPGRWVNHIPGNVALARKDRLAQEIREGMDRCSGRAGAPTATWHPRTFAMPEEREAFLRLARAEPELRWIRKPAGSARGDGVRLVTGPDEAARLGPGWIVQEYLTPHLIDGYKYTLRFYVAITSIVPLVVYVFDDGFTKFASRPFPGSREDATRFAHLTNPDVLSRDPDVPTSTRNLVRADYLDRLRAEGHDPVHLLRQVDELIACTVSAARERLLASVRAATRWPAGCFELLGLDVLLDSELKPWLIECNLDPSLKVEADPRERAAREEAAVKGRLISNLADLVGLTESAPGTASGFRLVFPNASLPAGWAMLTLPRPEDGHLLGGGAPPALVPASGVTSWEFGASLVLHSGADGHLNILNGTAAHLWLAIAEGIPPSEVLQEIADITGAPPGQVSADVWAVLAAWRESRLVIDRDGPPPAELECRRPARPHIAWNIGATYELAGTRVALQSPDWRVMEVLRPALGPLEVAVDDVHHRLEIRPCGAQYTVVVDGEESGPPLPIEMVGAACRNRIRSWAMTASDDFTFEGVGLLLPDGEAVAVAGPRRARSRLVDAWIADGPGVIADELVVLRAGAVLPLYLGRERPLASDADRRAGAPPLRWSLLDERSVPVMYEAIPDLSRCDGARRLAAVLLVTGSPVPASTDGGIAPATPEDVLVALLRARAGTPMGRTVAAQIIGLLSVTHGWLLDVPGALTPEAVGAVSSALVRGGPS